jgi:hypothetical protein
MQTRIVLAQHIFLNRKEILSNRQIRLSIRWLTRFMLRPFVLGHDDVFVNGHLVVIYSSLRSCTLSAYNMLGVVRLVLVLIVRYGICRLVLSY